MNQIVQLTKNKLLLLVLLFVISSGFAASQNINTVKLTLELKNATLVQIFDNITKKTNYNFTYGEQIAKNKIKYSAIYDNKSLNTVLEDLGKRGQFDFKVIDTEIMIAKTENKVGVTKNVLQQTTVSGKVTDVFGQALVGASIAEKGTKNGTMSDLDGKFKLKVSNTNGVLVVTYVGYKTKEINLKGAAEVQITLEEDATKLEDVVVTALGSVKRKKELTYATQRLTSEESNKTRGGDVSKQLGGRIAGLNVISNGSSGGLVSSSRLVIRGEKSLQIGNNEPLIIVDGVPISNLQEGTGGNFRTGFGDGNLPVDFGDGLSDINPDDIATIDVLKGANAAALYGQRAANGVILITTKSGKGKKFEVQVNTGLTTSQIFNTWDIQHSYGGGFNGNYDEFSGNNWGPAYNPELLIKQTGSPEFPNASPFIERFDWNDYFKTGTTYNNNIAIQSSNEMSNFRFSYTDQRKTGTVPNTDYNRRNISTNATVKLNDKFTVDFSGNYNNSFSENTPLQGFNPQSLMYSFIWYNFNLDLDWFKNYWKPGQENIAQNWPISYAINPYLIAEENLNSFNRNRVFGNIKTSFKPNQYWEIFFRAGIDYYDDRRESRRPPSQAQYAEGMYREQNIRFKETNFDFLATYKKEFAEDFSLVASFGGNAFEQNRSNSEIEGRRLAIPKLYTLSNIENLLRPKQSESKERVNSLYSKATLGWKDALFLEATARNDWSSTLSLNNNSYFYPSVGLSGVVSEFIKMPKSINYWKIRTNYAQVGNDTDPFIINPAYALGNAPGSLVNQSFIPLSNLKPEITTSFEVGTEIRLFNSRLNFECNFYNSLSKNQILQIPISASSGFAAQLINAGKIKNEGVELLLSGTPLKTANFEWSISGNWSRNVGRVEELANGINNFVIGSTDVNGGNIQARVGGLMGDIYGFGYSRSPDGDIIYLNGLPQRGNTQIKLGNYNPDWIAGLSSTFRYKFINASILMDYRQGGELVSRTTALLYRTGLAAETELRPAGGYVGEGVVLQPDGSYLPNTTNRSLQDYWRALKGDESNIEANIYDATYFKIREISLGFDMGKIVKIPFVKDMNISLFASNVFIWTKSDDLRHIDPENVAINGGTLVPGFEYTSLPPNRNYGMNLQFKF